MYGSNYNGIKPSYLERKKKDKKLTIKESPLLLSISKSKECFVTGLTYAVILVIWYIYAIIFLSL